MPGLRSERAHENGGSTLHPTLSGNGQRQTPRAPGAPRICVSPIFPMREQHLVRSRVASGSPLRQHGCDRTVEPIEFAANEQRIINPLSRLELCNPH
jgi:hypothetical protein